MKLNNVPKFHKPFPFWFWNGDIEPDELVRQLRLMHEKGFEEAICHARWGLTVEFLSDEWFRCFEAVLAEARRLGMRLWVYDEENWPSGAAGGKITGRPEFVEHYLDDAGKLQRVTDRPELSPDFLNRAATDEFIRLAYQSYYDRYADDFGKTIAGFFNDEVRFKNARPWSLSLGEPPEDPEFVRTVGRLMVENYFQPISDWCAAHGVDLIGHVMGEETIGSQVRYVGRFMDAVACFQQPGLDHLGGAAEGMHPRYVASVSHLLGGLPVTSETGAHLPWDFEVDDLYRLTGWLYASGMTRMILHGFFYQHEYGAALDDCPPDMFYRWEHWDEIGEYMDWAGRVQHFLSLAKPTCRVALYYPCEDFMADYVPDTAFTLNFEEGARVCSDRSRRLHVAMQELGAALTRAGIDYDIVPAEWMDRADVDVVVAPADTQPDCAVPVVQQGDRSAAACIAKVDGLLGRRVRVEGEGATPDPLPASEFISDPYVHKARDAGGVLTKEFVYEGRPAVMVWNANANEFSGTCDLVRRAEWTLWLPADGSCEALGVTDSAAIELPAWSMQVFLAG